MWENTAFINLCLRSNLLKSESVLQLKNWSQSCDRFPHIRVTSVIAVFLLSSSSSLYPSKYEKKIQNYELSISELT